MAEGEQTHGVSPVGALLIGLVLGFGIGLTLYALQTRRLNDEITKVRNERDLMERRASIFNAQLAEMRATATKK
ncbi:MAG TPA: hypothetical protein VGP72_20970 [Planctomycetota bacterium]|jgi:hypothetical protein